MLLGCSVLWSCQMFCLWLPVSNWKNFPLNQNQQCMSQQEGSLLQMLEHLGSHTDSLKLSVACLFLPFAHGCRIICTYKVAIWFPTKNGVSTSWCVCVSDWKSNFSNNMIVRHSTSCILGPGCPKYGRTSTTRKFHTPPPPMLRESNYLAAA